MEPVEIIGSKAVLIQEGPTDYAGGLPPLPPLISYVTKNDLATFVIDSHGNNVTT